MKNKKKRYPKYKELREIKLKHDEEVKEMEQKREIKKEIERVKCVGEDVAGLYGLTKEQVWSAMGLHRFNL